MSFTKAVVSIAVVPKPRAADRYRASERLQLGRKETIGIGIKAE